MSIAIQHSASAFATIEYEGKTEYKPKWIKEKQLLGYYNSMNKFYRELLEELEIPSQFNKEGIHSFLMNSLKRSLNDDEELRKLIVGISKNYPRFPMNSKQAWEYIRLLKSLSLKIAISGNKLNNEIALNSLQSDIPYMIFSNETLGNYTISYFQEYKARATQEHFRRNYLLTRGRPNLPDRKKALNNYFLMMKPIQNMFKDLVKSKFKLWLFITLSNSKSIKEFAKGRNFLYLKNIDRKQFEILSTEYSKQLETFREELYQLEPALFASTPESDEPTQIMWNDMILLRVMK